MTLATIPELIDELRAGRMVVLVDDEDRENEGDLVLAADHVSGEAINFMARFGRGLICLTLTEARCRQLSLTRMVNESGAAHGTNFTVSIEAAEGVTTGISAADRARTISAAVAPDARPSDLVQPGHVFPLMARPGGVLMRAGHTEAGCDLAELAGLTPAAVICEILRDDGSMARMPDLVEFSRQHGLKLGSIADLIHYRSANESLIERTGEFDVSTLWGPMRLVAYRDKPSGSPHMALVHGEVAPERETLVRVHEPLSVFDLIELERSSHSWPLHRAMQSIVQAPAGVAVLLNCSESALQVFDNLRRMVASADPEAQRAAERAARMDLRTYGVGAQILRDLGVGKMRLLAHPRKMPSMAGFDLEVAGFETGAD